MTSANAFQPRPHPSPLERTDLTKRLFSLSARVSTDSPEAVEEALKTLVTKGSVRRGTGSNELLVEAEVEGKTARDLNRALLSALRRAEKRTRLRAEWTSGNTTERFFDYVPKGIRKNKA
jgi:hypothetical protein